MTVISADDVQKNIEALLKRVEGGESFLIARDSKVPRPTGACTGAQHRS